MEVRMTNKAILKVGAALGILALALIFLGVNFVPQIFASSPSTSSSGVSAFSVRSNYTNESYQRSIAPQLSYRGSDWIERHPASVYLSAYYAGSDWIERHPVSVAPVVYYAGSDWIERHPSTYYVNSDWIDRHPSTTK
jgi:hypothetical protein